MTDLPARLRTLANEDLTGSFYALLEEAADRIESLEATLDDSPENFREQESEGRFSESTPEMNRYRHAERETGWICGW